jgi:NitT/TauT family transport system permease protein/taurine transport system permease protein
MASGSPRSWAGPLVGVAAIIVVFIAWYVLTSLTQIIDPARFPSPAEVGSAFRQIVVDGYADARLDQHILQSCKLILMGFAAAVIIGVPLGLAMGWSRRAEAFFNPVFLLIRPIPPLAWIPLAIVWLGLGDAAKVLVIWFAAFVPSVINSYTGVRSIEPHMLEAARTLGARKSRMWLEVLVPGAAPHIFTGLRLSLQAAWTTLVAAELIGALQGLGDVLSTAAQDLYPAMILVGMISVGVCGWGMTLILGVIERQAMPWRRA